MPWFRVNDRHNDHTKVERLEALCAGDGLLFFACRGVWEALGVDCAGRETDGAFTRMRAAKVLAALTEKQRERALGLLADSGLIEPPTEAGYQFHDWADYQPTKAELSASRKGHADRQRRWRAGVSDARVDASTDAVTGRVTNVATATSVPASVTPTHARAPAGARTGTGVSGIPSGSGSDAPARVKLEWADVGAAIRRGAGSKFDGDCALWLADQLTTIANQSGYTAADLEMLGRDFAQHHPKWCKDPVVDVTFLLGFNRDGAPMVQCMTAARGRRRKGADAPSAQPTLDDELAGRT